MNFVYALYLTHTLNVALFGLQEPCLPKKPESFIKNYELIISLPSQCYNKGMEEELILHYTNDYVFKYVFGSPEHQAARNGFINAVLNLDGPDRIVKSDVLNPFKIKETADDKLCILDILAKTKSGKLINLEMQARQEADYIQRVLYYACHLASSQLKSSDIYADLPPVVSISILDWNLKHHTNTHSIFRLLETRTHKELSRDLEFHFIQLKRFNPKKSLLECVPLERWMLLFLKGDQDMDELLDELKKDEGIAQAIQAFETCKSTEELRLTALSRERAIRSYNKSVRVAREEGEKAGRRTGEKIGREQGEKIGRQQGEKIGRQQGEKIGRQQGEKIGRQQGEKIGREQGEKIGREQGEKIGREQGEILGQLQAFFSLLNSGALPKDRAKQQMQALLGKGHDELVNEFLQRLEEAF